MYLFGNKIVYKKGILKECIRSYFLQGSIFYLGIHMSVSKPSICFWKWVISNTWRNKLLIHNIHLTGHRKSACCLQLLVFLEIWVIAPFWHCCHHDLKAFFVRLRIKVYFWMLWKIWSKIWKIWRLAFYLSLLFTHLVEGPWRTRVWNQK